MEKRRGDWGGGGGGGGGGEVVARRWYGRLFNVFDPYE